MPDVPRFCPFCRECYEEVDRCPEHDLALVPFDRLAPEGGDGPAEDEPLGLHDLRFGRGWLLLAVVLLLVGMGLPLVSSGHATASAYDLATDRALNLWIVVAVAGALLSIWMRRRTLILMRGSRVAVAALALMAVASLAYTLVRVHRASALVDRAFRVEWGAHVLLAGAVAALIAAARLGVIRQRRRL